MLLVFHMLHPIWKIQDVAVRPHGMDLVTNTLFGTYKVPAPPDVLLHTLPPFTTL